MKKYELSFFLALWIWLIALPVQLEAQTVYVTKTGEKYHVTTCRYLHSSKISIELTDAVKKGYGACKVCKPSHSSRQSLAPRPSSSSTVQSSRQCSALTQAGARCKRKTKSADGKCWQHQE